MEKGETMVCRVAGVAVVMEVDLSLVLMAG